MKKKTGFLSFGHYRDVPGARVPSARTALHDHIELAVVAEQVGLDGAWVRVHHFDESHSTPYPLLAAMAARTTSLDLGTGVVDLRYENPLALAELAASVDLISAGRLQLGISRGSPENAVDGQAAFGYKLTPGEDWGEVTRHTADRFLQAISAVPMARSHTAQARNASADLPVRPQSPGLRERIWWGAGTHRTGIWTGTQGMNLVSSTLLLADDGRPFHLQQADQIRAFREARTQNGYSRGVAAVTRAVFPLVTADDHRYFGREQSGGDQVGFLDGSNARSGPTIVGDLPEISEALSHDEAVCEADYVLFALPSQIGVEYNSQLLANLAELAHEMGWKE